MGAGTTVSVLPCGAMTADLTWLPLAPGRAIRNRQNKHLPAEWVDVPAHCVLVDTPDGKLLWDTSCPRDWEGQRHPDARAHARQHVGGSTCRKPAR